MNRALRYLAILLLIIVTSILHYRTDTDHLYLHEIYQRVYYIPILLAAFWYGPIGGVAAASLTCVIYVYHIRTDWAHLPAYSINQYAEIVLYYLVGLIIGFLALRERRERKKLEATTAELSRAYDRIRQTSEQLRRSERLAALGALTAGIAHEVRNPLGSIKGAVEILEEDFPADHPKREFVDIVKEELTRLNSTLSEFLRFANPKNTNFESISLNELIETTVTLLSKQAQSSAVRIEKELDRSIPLLKADKDQIRQILLNIMLNGIQAMPDGGVLMIRSRLDPDENAVGIEVSDSGRGIDDCDLERVFDPFFSTKPAGMGLGMSITHQLVMNHGGTIGLKKNPENGLTVSIELPVDPTQRAEGDFPARNNASPSSPGQRRV